MMVLTHVDLVGHLKIVWLVILQGTLVCHITKSHIPFLEMQFKKLIDFRFSVLFDFFSFKSKTVFYNFRNDFLS